MLNLKNLFTLKYLFQIDRVTISRGDKLFFAIGAGLILLALVLKFAAVYSPTPADKKYRHKFYSLFLTVGLIELVWYGARVQNVRFFGTHFVSLLVLSGGFAWFVWLAVKMIKNYSSEKQLWEKEQVRQKYLPK